VRPIVVAIAFAAHACAHSPVESPAGKSTTLFEDERLRVRKVEVSAGEESALHEHADAIAVALTDTKINFTLPDATTREVNAAAFDVFVMPAATASQNAGGRFAAIIVEVKQGPPVTPLTETARTPASLKRTQKQLVTSGRAQVFRLSFQRGYEESKGTIHDADAVLIPASEGEATLTQNGGTVKLRKGGVYVTPRGLPHHAKVTSPIEIIVVRVNR
jgi:quercetin dioxygenase-like cupin family protein